MDQHNHEEIVHAVPSHPFYSIDRQEFIPIGQFGLKEHVKNNLNNTVALIKKQRHTKKIETVYNFEVYQTHNYKIGSNKIMVHNPTEECDRIDSLIEEGFIDGHLAATAGSLCQQ